MLLKRKIDRALEWSRRRRLIADGREKGLLVDASFGRSTRSVLLMNSGHLILSAQSPEELMKQLNLIQEGGRLPSAGEN